MAVKKKSSSDKSKKAASKKAAPKKTVKPVKKISKAADKKRAAVKTKASPKPVKASPSPKTKIAEKIKKEEVKKIEVKKIKVTPEKIADQVQQKPENGNGAVKKANGEKPVQQTAKKSQVIVEQKPIAISNYPKNKVKTILVSQPRPDSEKSPYLELARKHNLKIDFRQFITIEGVPAKEFRQQRTNILDHNAVILTSRIAIDHYFRMAQEMRITIPETMKYFCLSESIAYYLQKYVQYRKRKIFYGHQTIADLVDVIKKHKEEKFLLPVSDVHREQIVDFLDEMQVKYTKATFYRTVAADLSDMKGQLDYDVVVFFTPAGIRSLRKNFPGLKQGNIRIAAFGYNTAQAVQENGLRLDIHAPTPQAPSMTMALEHYIKEANKR